MNVDIFGSSIEIDETAIAESPGTIRRQVEEYERGDRREFDLTVSTPDGPRGDVMAALAAIPYGETRTYGGIAAELDTEPVLVGRACAQNPVPVVVPCHRVIGSDGGLKGYSAADGVVTKRRLLNHERRQCGTATVQTELPTDG